MSVGDLNETAKQRGMQSEYEVVKTAIDTYNTQDVTVGEASAIGAATAAAKISGGGTSGFQKYLKRSTKYYYTWTATDASDLKVGDAATANMVYDGETWGTAW